MQAFVPSFVWGVALQCMSCWQISRVLKKKKKKTFRGMCYLYSLQFSCLLFVLCPVIRNSLLQSVYNSSNVFLGPLRTCTATASLTNGSRQGGLTWTLESSGLLSHPWDDVLRAIHQTQAVQQSWAVSIPLTCALLFPAGFCNGHRQLPPAPRQRGMRSGIPFTHHSVNAGSICFPLISC